MTNNLNDISAIIAFQGFQDFNRFVIKEIAYLTIDGEFERYILRPLSQREYQLRKNDATFRNSNSVKYVSNWQQLPSKNYIPPLYNFHSTMHYVNSKIANILIGDNARVNAIMYDMDIYGRYVLHPNINYLDPKKFDCPSVNDLIISTSVLHDMFFDNYDCAYHRQTKHTPRIHHCATTQLFCFAYWLSFSEHCNNRSQWHNILSRWVEFKPINPNSAYHKIQLSVNRYATTTTTTTTVVTTPHKAITIIDTIKTETNTIENTSSSQHNTINNEKSIMGENYYCPTSVNSRDKIEKNIINNDENNITSTKPNTITIIDGESVNDDKDEKRSVSWADIMCY